MPDWRHLAVTAVAIGSQAVAGEIAGTPSQAPPFIQRDLEINFSNDFLGRGGGTDDFRTQQLIVTARLRDKWIALVDHSTLTLGRADPPGRLDQLSVSVGYRLVHDVEADVINALTVGGGLRGSGEFSGARMQNGFHRLVGSKVETMPYVGTERTDVTAWADGERYALLHESAEDGFLGGWSTGYWLRGNTLLTSDGQWDAALGAYAVGSKGAVDLWLGLRRDWRTGYDRDPVQIATADAEDDLSVVFGLRFGALIVETVQQTGNDASYGQLKLVSGGRSPFPTAGEWPRFRVGLGFVVPDVHLQLEGKLGSLLLDLRYGEPQYGDDTSIYIKSRQIGLGIEWERQLGESRKWISAYASIGGGVRSEQLIGDEALEGQRSDSVSRGVATAATGLRFNAASLGGGWHYRLQLGLTGWLPFSDATVQFDGRPFRIQQPALGVAIGMTFDYE